jgi:hypothetical protein
MERNGTLTGFKHRALECDSARLKVKTSYQIMPVAAPEGANGRGFLKRPDGAPQSIMRVSVTFFFSGEQ